MDGKVLVAYATRYGSTAEMAEAVAETLEEAGATVDVMPADEVTDVRPYGAVILGSPLYGDKILEDAAEVVERFQEPLQSTRVAYFVMGWTLRKDTPENRGKMRAALDDLPSVYAVDVGLFAGSTAHIPWYLKLGLWLIGRRPRDLRDWEAISAWAQSLLPKLGLG